VTRACVVGSTNVDLVLRVPALPAPGETVLGRDVRREAGGKGGNQAVALARLGARTRLVSAVGSDAEGLWSLEQLRTDDVDTTDVLVTDSATGLAVVVVDDHRENSIVVSPGANARVAPPSDLEDDDVLLLSLEVPLATVTASAVLGRQSGVPVVLNAAPAQPLQADLLDAVDVLVVNESEWDVLGRRRERSVVVTLGARGCLVVAEGAETALPAVPVDAVDTTGAGDCFAAALAFAVAEGQPLLEAAAFATRAAAASVTAAGARAGLPTMEQLTAAGS
jgi:ribokinase